MDDSAIMCDEAVEPYHRGTKSIQTNFIEKKAICKMQNFCILLAFSLISIALLIV